MLENQTPEVDHHGTGAAWCPPLAGHTFEGGLLKHNSSQVGLVREGRYSGRTRTPPLVLERKEESE
jgi:hypothetical protein